MPRSVELGSVELRSVELRSTELHSVEPRSAELRSTKLHSNSNVNSGSTISSQKKMVKKGFMEKKVWV